MSVVPANSSLVSIHGMTSANTLCCNLNGDVQVVFELEARVRVRVMTSANTLRCNLNGDVRVVDEAVLGLGL